MVNLLSKVEHAFYLADGTSADLLTFTYSLTEPVEGLQVSVQAPNGRSSWLTVPQKEGSLRYTIGPLGMGKDVALSEGTYHLSFLLADGRTLFEETVVQVPSLKVSLLPVYDAETNTITYTGQAEVFAYDEANALLSHEEAEQPVRFPLQEGIEQVVLRDAQSASLFVWQR